MQWTLFVSLLDTNTSIISNTETVQIQTFAMFLISSAWMVQTSTLQIKHIDVFKTHFFFAMMDPQQVLKPCSLRYSALLLEAANESTFTSCLAVVLFSALFNLTPICSPVCPSLISPLCRSYPPTHCLVIYLPVVTALQPLFMFSTQTSTRFS